MTGGWLTSSTMNLTTIMTTDFSIPGGTETVSPLGLPPLPSDGFVVHPPLASEAEDPFDDFDEDDFDDEFDDDFEEDWEDDLTEDEEFPDTFGGHEDEKKEEEKKKSPFSDDPDFDKK